MTEMANIGSIAHEFDDPQTDIEGNELDRSSVPDGVEKFKSKVGKDTEYTFTIPGIYAYWCTPHKTMGMIGFIIVGDDLSNLESIKKVKFLAKSKKLAKALIEEIEG